MAWDRQKAPSAKRCIKTAVVPRQSARRCAVRKRRVPKGALRPDLEECVSVTLLNVRKHRAPNGALRLKVSHKLVATFDK
mgnify:FL=1